MDVQKKQLIQDLLNFINLSPTAFQATQNIKENLVENGYLKLDETKPWSIKKEGKFFVERNNSSIIAFKIGKKDFAESGFRLIGAHTDSPALKIKPLAEKNVKNYVKLGIEVYGGPIVHTWTDRELSIAGRVITKKDSSFETQLIDFHRPLALIPNLAIHLNRQINKGFEYNKHTHLPAIFTQSENVKEKQLNMLIAEELNIEVDTIQDFDLFLYDVSPGSVFGVNNEFVSVGRLDDLAMCHSILQALHYTEDQDSTLVGIFYDNEEIGSSTLQGADSSYLKDILQRLIYLKSDSQEDYSRAIASSFMISADMAHALHPNYPEKHDEAYAPVINGGPVVKSNANYRYATTSETAVYFMDLCNKSEVPFQVLNNRADIPTGSTIGPISSAIMGIKTVDVGNPMWGMHSIRETGGVKDHFYMTKVFKTFFQN